MSGLTCSGDRLVTDGVVIRVRSCTPKKHMDQIGNKDRKYHLRVVIVYLVGNRGDHVRVGVDKAARAKTGCVESTCKGLC